MAESGVPAGREAREAASRNRSPVRVVAVDKRNIDVQLKALGTVTPINTVTVRSRLDGELMRVQFTEGQSVSEGQVLAEIDPRPFQVALNQVLGQQQENQARLKNAERRPWTYQKLRGRS